MMEMLVTSDNSSYKTGRLQSNCHHQHTSTGLIIGWMPFLSPNQMCLCQSTELSHSKDLPTLRAHMESTVFVLTTKGSRLPWRRVAKPLVSPLLRKD